MWSKLEVRSCLSKLYCDPQSNHQQSKIPVPQSGTWAEFVMECRECLVNFWGLFCLSAVLAEIWCTACVYWYLAASSESGPPYMERLWNCTERPRNVLQCCLKTALKPCERWVRVFKKVPDISWYAYQSAGRVSEFQGLGRKASVWIVGFRPWHGCLASLMQKILHSMRKIVRVKNQESWQLDRFVPVSGLSIYSMFLLDVLLYDGHIRFLMILVLKIGNRTGKSFN